jgi:hypothetical protein
VAIRGFMYLILEQLRAVPEPSPATNYGSQASGSQVRTRVRHGFKRALFTSRA